MTPTMRYETNTELAEHLPEDWKRPSHAEDDSFKAWQINIEARAPKSSQELLFDGLAGRWLKETAKHSTLLKIVTHPAYQRIIGMGPIAIPFILKRLKQSPDHWFWALDALTQGLSPAEGCTNLEDAAKAWIQWGNNSGKISAD